jgi:hypothetical protein
VRKYLRDTKPRLAVEVQTTFALRGGSVGSTHPGHAKCKASGEASFEVHGLALNGSNASGTASPVTTVTGTLVCNPGINAQVVRDTAEVRLSQQGEAHFRGGITRIPALCANAALLLPIGPSLSVSTPSSLCLNRGGSASQDRFSTTRDGASCPHLYEPSSISLKPLLSHQRPARSRSPTAIDLARG